jgi:membrane associated rhomboid family serine protease
MLPLKDNIPTRTTPVVTIGLIVANTIVWFWQMSRPDLALGDSFFPCDVNNSCVAGTPPHLPWYEGAFTSMFMHGGWLHILGNMLFLWIFGNNVEDALGHVRFLIVYVMAGLAAAALQTFVTLHWAGAQGASVPNVGASGAIAGVLGAYFVLYPGAKVTTAVFVFLVFFIQVRAVYFLGYWFLLQLFEGGIGLTHPQSGGGVAFFAHVGGFLFGMLTAWLLAQRRQPARQPW